MTGYTTRITAGRFRYKLLRQPSKGTRPISQKVRQAIFSVLGEDLSGLAVLDLYAGSGAMGFEALSRGASGVVAVEKSRVATECLQANVIELGVADECQLEKTDVSQFLNNAQDSFDIIFFDPPYADFDVSIVELAVSRLALGGILVISCSSQVHLTDIMGSAQRVKSRKYGETQIAYYRM